MIVRLMEKPGAEEDVVHAEWRVFLYCEPG